MDKSQNNVNRRIQAIYGLVFFICAVFIARLFYLQVIKYDFYNREATVSQLRSYDIPAERGIIYAFDGEERVPLVLNELKYNIVADPQIIDDKNQVALVLADLLGVDKQPILDSLNVENSRYQILAKKQSKEVKQQIEQLYEDGEIVGVFNDDGEGNYGVEEYLDDKLGGTPGRLKALTDQNGIPLLASGENIQEDPVDGSETTLTIDVAMQRQLEDILKTGLKDAKSKSGSALIVDPNSGAVRAMANYPSYDPGKFTDVEDALLFTNASVSSVLEPGSVVKVLTAAAAIDTGSVEADGEYFDPGFYTVDGKTITNVSEVAGSGNRTISDILRLSLNTGATYLLQQMGGGEVNEQARETWHTYMTEHYRFGGKTGIEQGFEEPGLIPEPNDGFGLNIKYANTAFGQGMTVTPIQLAAAVSAVVNGGTYYQPYLVHSTVNSDGEEEIVQPAVVREGVVQASTSESIREMMENVVSNNLPSANRKGYKVGGKTGTAEIANPDGGYFEDKFNGTYVGYVGGNTPEYLIVVRVNEPGIDGYAGSQAAGPIFSDLINMLVDNFSVTSEL